LEHQLVSKYTSFVAVEKGDERIRGRGRGRNDRAWVRSRLPRGFRADAEEDPASEDSSFLDGVLDGLSAIIASVFDYFSGPSSATNTPPRSSRPHRQPNVPGAYATSDPSVSEGSRDNGREDRQRRQRSVSSHYSNNTFTTLSSLEGSSGSSYWSRSRTPSPLPPIPDPIERANSPEFVQDENAPQRPRATNPLSIGNDTSTTRQHRLPVSQEANALFNLLNVDGSFTPSPRLQQIVGDALDKAEEQGVDKTVWATAVAVAYLKKHMEGEPDLMDALLVKVQQFVEARLGSREFEELVRKASVLLGSP